MKDQHTKIKGYRDLSQAEIDLMNAIKTKAEEVKELITKVCDHLTAQNNSAYEGSNFSFDSTLTPEQERLSDAEPFAWLEKAQDDLQVGFMKLVRSVAQPTSF